MEAAVRCRGIKKFYGKHENKVEALKGIDLDLYQGQLTLLVGPSGSGKTTLLSILATILTPDAGQLFLLDHEVSRMPEREKAEFRNQKLGIVFQSLFLIPTLTVLENITLPLVIAGVAEDIAQDRAKELLKLVHLEKRANTSPAALSKGQQQKVAIARAMINESKIILCDEPTSSLDQASGVEVMNFIHHLAIECSKAVLVVTHDHRIFSFASRIVNMNDGQIVAEDKNE